MTGSKESAMSPNAVAFRSFPLPSETDDSDTVNAFVSRLLAQAHGMEEERAHAIVDQQTIGGKELREMPFARHRELFGDQVARILYKEVRARALEEEYDRIMPEPSREEKGESKFPPHGQNPVARRIEYCD